jgi:ketosteroid isomerase-like protein
VRTAAVALWLLSAALPLGAQPPSAAEKEIRAVEERRYKAMVEADYAALDKLLADDLLYAHSSGDIDDKNKLVGAMRSGARTYKKMTTDETRYRVDGKLAVVTGRVAVEVARDGKPTSFRARFTAVYEKAPAGWRLAAWQTTRLPEN